jgi:Arsenate reductase and related proteins, glutaredoxin family
MTIKNKRLMLKTVKKWLDAKGADVILNKKGTTWKKLSEEEQQTALASEENLIQCLTAHSSMIKRPVLDTGSDLLVGFDENAYRALK